MPALYPPVHPRFLIRSSLGRGAVGVVYRAYDRELEQEVALKTLPCATDTLTPAEVRGIKDEFRSLAVIAHPNLVQLYELFVSAEHCFFTMELVRGVSPLQRAWGSDSFSGRVDHAFLRRFLRQLASALRVIHAQHQVHRDITPGNLLVDASDRVVLLDFGLVVRARDLVREIAGTLPYMSPEQRNAENLTSAADWYSVGALLYQALTGRFPPMADAPVQPSELPRGTPPDLAELAAALLQHAPGRRPSGQAVLRSLDASQHGAAAGSSGILPTVPANLFVGREQELARLASLLRGGRATGMTLIGVEGESGIGKTALLERVLAELAREEPHMLQLRSLCRDQESIPFRAIDGWLDGLSDCPRNTLASKFRRRRIPFRAELCRVFPVLAALGPIGARTHGADAPAEPGELRRRAFAGLKATLHSVARARRLVLWIDDAHWGDADSAAFVRDLIESNPASCALVLTYRSDEAQGSPFLSTLQSELRGRTFELGALSDASSRELTEALVGDAAGADVERICRTAAGSPFLIGELAHARSGRSDVFDAQADVSDRWMSARLGALSAAQRAILEVAALAKGPLAEEVLLTAAELPKADRTQIMALQSLRLIRRRPIDGTTSVQPHDVRTRDTVLAHIPATRCTALHGAIALALERRPGTAPEILAHHFAGAGDRSRAARYAELAGDRSAAAFAFDQAAEFFRQSLAWSPGPREHAYSLLQKLAQALTSGTYTAEWTARTA